MFLLRKFTIWLSILSILICLNHYWGNDDKNILLIGLNPVLNNMVYTELFQHWLFYESANYYRAYLVHFLSFLLIGIVIDVVIKLLRRKKSR
jgi:hypothetical protein